MTAEYGTEQSVLHPAHVEFLELRIARSRALALRVIAIAEEAADVGIEVRIARQREVQSGRHLLAQHVPRRGHVATPHVRAIVLLTCIRRTGHDEDALATVVLTLCLIDAANGGQRERVTLRTPRAAIHLMVIVALLRIKEIGIGRVHPPRIRTIVVQRLQVLPVDGASLRMEGIVHLHTRRIFHDGWPYVRDATLGPRLERHQQTLRVQFAELLGHGSEAGPDADHEVGMLLVYVLNHLLTVGKILRQEVHRVPQVVRAPVLPVLDDTVERHLQRTILIDDGLRFLSRLIALLRLPEAVRPQREHRHVARQLAHQGNDTVGRATIHKVVVDALPCLRGKRHALGIVLKHRGRVVLPVDTIALDRLQHILEVLQVRLFHAFLQSATVQLAVLHGTQAVDGLVLVEGKGLADLKLIGILTHHSDAFLLQQHLALIRHEHKCLCLGLQLHGQLATLPGIAFLRHRHLLWLQRHHQRLGGLSFHHMNNTWSHELHLYISRPYRHTCRQNCYYQHHDSWSFHCL